MESTLALFKALPITTKAKKTSSSLLKKSIARGIIFSPEVIGNYSENELLKILDDNFIGGMQMNSSFHKSWQKVKTASLEDLVLEQIIHYMTTYGAKALGIYDKDSVYIPEEKLKIPKIDIKEIQLTIIKGYTKKELKEKLLLLLNSGIALSEKTVKYAVDIATFVELTSVETEAVKNKEARTILYDYLGFIPGNNIEFLRYAVYKSINKSLLIKDKATIAEIKTKDNLNVLGILEKYGKLYGYVKLAEVFYRFKPIFLAFRTSKKLKVIINKIRRLALKHHIPMKEDYLNTITAKINNGIKIDKKLLCAILEKVNVFRKIRLAYALKYRLVDGNSILYKIRNGKAYGTDFSFDNITKAKDILEIVLDSVISDIKEKVKGKKIYIPDYIEYALPATEKQFTGQFPSGTCVRVEKNIVFGVHWNNLGNTSVDLDLSLLGKEKIGWDRRYRDKMGWILFSGDVTDAPLPNGASELFFIRKQDEMHGLLMLNYYNQHDKDSCPIDIFVGEELLKGMKFDYMINQNSIKASAKTEISQKQKLLGLVHVSKEACKFYFCEAYLGKGVTSSNDKPYIEHTKNYLFNYYQNMISFKDVLIKAGAKISEKANADIDLSPEALDKNTFLSLLS